MLVVRVNLLAKLVNELIEAEVDFSLHLIVQVLLAEDGQCVMGTIVIKIQRIQNTSAKIQYLVFQ